MQAVWASLAGICSTSSIARCSSFWRASNSAVRSRRLLAALLDTGQRLLVLSRLDAAVVELHHPDAVIARPWARTPSRDRAGITAEVCEDAGELHSVAGLELGSSGNMLVRATCAGAYIRLTHGAAASTRSKYATMSRARVNVSCFGM